MTRATAGNLDRLLGLDTLPVRIGPDGMTSERRDVSVPDSELYVNADLDGQVPNSEDSDLMARLRARGWDVLTGWTGQYSYNGPLMHSSEYVGGGLARHILANPGTYAAAVVECVNPDGSRDETPAGWIVVQLMDEDYWTDWSESR